jgi:signal transduction histidine kinase
MDRPAGGEASADGEASGSAARTLVLGRDPTSDVPIDDLNISRRHAEISLRADETVLRDLESTNGTFVNGELVAEKPLVNGDRISIGDSLVVFEESTSRRHKMSSASAPPRPGTQSVTFHDRADDAGAGHIRLDPKASGYLDPVAVKARPEAAVRLAKLYKFISEVAPVVSPERLAEEVLNRTFEAIGADRGFVMLLDDSGKLRPEHVRVKDPARSAETIRLSSRMTQQALETGQSIMSSDALHDRRFKDTVAFSANRVSSFICAPLKHRDKVIGLLYVDTLGSTDPLSKDDLELVTAMSLLAGTQFANTRFYADIANSAEYTQSILRCLRSGVVVTGLDLKVRQVNEAACDLLKRREQELVARSLTDFKTLRPLWRIMQETVQSGIPSERQEIVVEVAGEQVPLGISTSLLRDHENRLRGVVANFRSLSVIKRLSEQVRMAQHLAALGGMAAGIAHEIRNPLNSIRGFAQLLGEVLPDAAAEAPEKLESARGYVKIIVEEVDRMNQLVQDLLDFSRQRELTMMETDLTTLVADTLRELGPDLTQAGVEVVQTVPEGPVPVVANAAKLKQVLVNMVRNAIQAMTPPVAPEGRNRRLEVSLAAADETGTAEIAVKDSGTGMDEDTRARIFEPFFTTRERGTGLGLAICGKIVQKHGGAIKVESRPGAGSAFRIVLPRG